MDELRELYQEVIIDHGRRPRNFRALEEPCRCQEGYNPVCGDKLKLCLRLGAGSGGQTMIQDIAFLGQGCAISMASASLLSEALKGRSREEAEQLFHLFHRLLTETPPPDAETLGKLRVLAGVREFPTRIKCATLAWHALMGALVEARRTPVTTE